MPNRHFLRQTKYRMTDEFPESKQQRREKRRAAKEAKMAKHGKSIADIYRDVVLKRLNPKKPDK